MNISNETTLPAVSVNRFHKDRLFKALFGSEQRKKLTLDLYNAIHNSSYQNPEDIHINTLEDVIYMGMKNDVSFLLADSMNLYEQQSTQNPNMPLRFFLYAAHLYEKYIKANDLEKYLYSSKGIALPAPSLVMLYNGKGENPTEYLFLSDAFEQHADSDIQVRVRVINISYPNGSDILKHCKPLRDYAYVVHAFQAGRANKGNMKALQEAIASMEPGDVQNYLLEHQYEVMDMLLTEYNEEKTLKCERDIGYLKALIDLVQKGLLKPSDAASQAHLSEDEFQKEMARITVQHQ